MDKPLYKLNEIEEIPYPTEYLDALKGLAPSLIESIERTGLSEFINSGTVKLQGADKSLCLPLFFFYWIVELNEIIGNLNLVLADLRILPRNYASLAGSPKDRFYLLVRTFFYEFQRFREIMNIVIKALQRRGVVKKEEVGKIREAFHKCFEETFEMRNKFVHDGSPTWKGEKHFKLFLSNVIPNFGFPLKDEEQANKLSLDSALNDICNHYADVLRHEGLRMSRLLQQIVKGAVHFMSKSKQGSFKQ